MYTQCPTCATLFRITPEQLRQAGGCVRCCMCQHVFNALATVTDALPENLDVDRYGNAWKSGVAAVRARAAEQRSQPEFPAGESRKEVSPSGVEMDELVGPPDAATDLGEAIDDEGALVDEFRVVSHTPGAEPPVPDTPPVPEPELESEPEPEGADSEPLLTSGVDNDLDLSQPELPGLAPDDEAPAELGKPARSDVGYWGMELEPELPEAGLEQPYHPWRTLLWSLGVLLLTVLLVFQYTYFTRADLARYPEARPWLEFMCSQLGCELPLRKDVSQVRILRSDVTAAPHTKNALLAKALLVNEAPFPQPYPLLKLTLMDARGRETGSRWFHPRQYLKDDALKDALVDGMPPQRPVAARLIIKDPGTGADQYRFEVK